MELAVVVTCDENDPGTEEVLRLLEGLKKIEEFKLVKLRIQPGEKKIELPQLEIGPYKLHGQMTEQQILIALRAAKDRQNQIKKIEDSRPRKRKVIVNKFTFSDRFSLWFSNHYMLVFNIFVLLYVGVPFLAPVFMHFGWYRAANGIYKVYSILCHQLAFRSFFLFGKQAVYPRLLSHLNYPLMYEFLVHHLTIDLNEARALIGDTVIGYKVALCQRDVAMYGSLFLFGVVFSFFKDKIKSIKMWLWILLGILPIGIDGASQLPALGLDIKWLPARESTPFFRVLTGIMFGVFTAWYLYPMIEENMNSTRTVLSKKKMVLQQLSEQNK